MDGDGSSNLSTILSFQSNYDKKQKAGCFGSGGSGATVPYLYVRLYVHIVQYRVHCAPCVHEIPVPYVRYTYVHSTYGLLWDTSIFALLLCAVGTPPAGFNPKRQINDRRHRRSNCTVRYCTVGPSISLHKKMMTRGTYIVYPQVE